MPLEAPILDDLQYDDLVAQARARIARYTPEWTDQNDSDPGMTLVQLFAWLTEMIGVRLNQVPQRNYIKFLKLLNLELAPAQPATAYLTFTVREDADSFGPVPRSAQIAGQSEEGELVVFETDEALDLIPMNLGEVQVNDGFAFHRVPVANEDPDTTFRPLGSDPQVGSALYLGFGEGIEVSEDEPISDEDPARSLPANLKRHARTFGGKLQLRVFLPADNEGFDPISLQPAAPSTRGTEAPRRLIDQLRRLLENETLVQFPPSASFDETRRELLSRVNQFQPPKQLLVEAAGWFKDELPVTGYPLPARWVEEKAAWIASVRQLDTSDVPVERRLQWEYRSLDDPTGWTRLPTIDDESQGFTTDGTIKLQSAINIIPSLAGRVQDRFLYWIRCRLVQGRYPASTAPRIEFIRANTVTARNLQSHVDEPIGESNGLANQTFTLRHRPILGGSLEELLVETASANQPPQRWKRVDEIHSAGPDDRVFQLNHTSAAITFGDGTSGMIPPLNADISAPRYRAGGGERGNLQAGAIGTPLINIVGVDQVTNVAPAMGGEDEQPLEELQRRAPGILRRRSRAVVADDFASFSEEIAGVGKARAIPLAHPDHPGIQVPGSVTVVLTANNQERPPKPSRQLMQLVARRLNEVRLITTEVHLREPAFYEVSVSVRVRARSTESFSALRIKINDQLNEFLDANRWEFGRDLYPSELFGTVQQVDGVIVENLSLRINGLSHEDLTRPVRLPPEGLVFGVQQHNVVVESEIDL